MIGILLIWQWRLLNLKVEKLDPLRNEIGSDSKVREMEVEIITGEEVRKEDQGNGDFMSMDDSLKESREGVIVYY